MSSHIEIWNLLNKVKVSSVTQAQLNEMTSRVAVDKDAVEFWSGMITVARAIGESRTFAHGLPIYDTGAVLGNELADGANETFTPTGTEIWRVQAIDVNGCSAALRDSNGNMCLIQDTSLPNKNGFPLYLSSSMSLFFLNGSGSPATPKFAYHKVSL